MSAKESTANGNGLGPDHNGSICDCDKRRGATEPLTSRAVANRTETRLLSACRAIHQGIAVGHARRDIDASGEILFLNEAPWVVAYEVESRHVLRILHGARDLPALFDAGSD